MLRDAIETPVCQDLNLEVTSSMMGVEYEEWLKAICMMTDRERLIWEQSEAIIDGMGPMLDRSREMREAISQVHIPNTLEELAEHLNSQLETRPAIGDHGAWQEWYIDHSNCGGTWVYIKDPCNPRVVCSCTMGMGFND